MIIEKWVPCHWHSSCILLHTIELRLTSPAGSRRIFFLWLMYTIFSVLSHTLVSPIKCGKLSREIIALEVPGAKNEVHGRLEQFVLWCLNYSTYAFINFTIKLHLKIQVFQIFNSKKIFSHNALTLSNSQAKGKAYIE